MQMLYQTTKNDKCYKTNYRPVSILQKFMTELFIISFMNTSMINLFLVNVGYVRDTVLNTVF